MSATLLLIILCHVAPGTVIHSDQGSMYCRVSSLPGVASHGTVNQSMEFLNSTIIFYLSHNSLHIDTHCLVEWDEPNTPVSIMERMNVKTIGGDSALGAWIWHEWSRVVKYFFRQATGHR